jgi:plasmid maintenance system antidote protein VapI
MQLRDRNRLAAAMASKHYNATDLARLIPCHRSYIGHLLTGERKSCSPKMAVKIERALHVEPGWLFEARIGKKAA